jgi:hypothetical protein
MYRLRIHSGPKGQTSREESSDAYHVHVAALNNLMLYPPTPVQLMVSPPIGRMEYIGPPHPMRIGWGGL